MSLFKKNPSLAELGAQNEELVKQLATLTENFSADKAVFTKEKESFVASVNELKTQVQGLIDEKAKVETAHKLQLEETAKVKADEVAKAAAVQVATTIGVTVDQLPPKTETKISLREQASKLQGAELDTFLKNNNDALRKEMRSAKKH